MRRRPSSQASPQCRGGRIRGRCALAKARVDRTLLDSIASVTDGVNLADLPMLTDEQISELRSHFPILQEKTYLYNCSQGALSDAVEDGMRKYAASWRTSA